MQGLKRKLGEREREIGEVNVRERKKGDLTSEGSPEVRVRCFS